MNIGPEPSRKSTYSLPFSSQMRPPLPARCRMPGVVVAAGRLAEDDAGRREGRRGLAAGTLVLPFDLDVAEASLALVIDVEVMDAHEFLPLGDLPGRA